MKAEELRKQLLNVLGIEPDEEFYTEQALNTYKQRYNSKFKYFEYYCNVNKKWYYDSEIAKDLFSGRAKFVGKFWKPEYGEKYYFVEENGDINYFRNDNCYLDLMYWHMGNCFKSEEEAKANKDRVVEMFRSDTSVWKVANLRWDNE